MNPSTSRAAMRRSASPRRLGSRVDEAAANGAPPIIVRTRHPTGGQETNGADIAIEQGTLLFGVDHRRSRQGSGDHAVDYSSVETLSVHHSINGGVTVDDDRSRNTGKSEEPTCENSTRAMSSVETTISDTIELQREEVRLRKRLNFHFLNPYEKFKVRKKVPWKLILQFLKVLLVTAQLIIFGNYRFNHTKYYNDNLIAFEHLFLKGWDSVREIHAYPPAAGSYAIYKTQSFYDYFDFIAATHKNLTPQAINPVFPCDDVNFCVKKFGDGIVFPNLTWTIDFDHLVPQENCIVVDIGENFSSTKFLAEQDFDVPWATLQSMKINFSLDTLTYLKLGPLFGPECFNFRIIIDFDNSDYDGQMPVHLKIEPHRKECPEPRILSNSNSFGVRVVNYVVMMLCLFSLILCVRALIRAQFLKYRAKRFFKERYGWEMTTKEKLLFLNGWYMVICVNDILILIGSVIKEMIETRNTYGDLWDFCALFLGLGNLLVWLGMLRYLGFFENYNILILTLKGAMPNIMRFILCTSFIYLGFVFCGWAILGPYHFKFQSIMSTSECLFSLINADDMFAKLGDDMFATFSSVPDSSMLIYIFSRIYLYTFIALFIYVILSIFIAIIMDVYDIIKEYQKDKSWPKCRIKDFYSKVTLVAAGDPVQREVDLSMTYEDLEEEENGSFSRLFSRAGAWIRDRRRRRNDHDEDGDPLMRSAASSSGSASVRT